MKMNPNHAGGRWLEMLKHFAGLRLFYCMDIIRRFPGFARITGLMLLLTPGGLTAQTAVDEDAPWPRVRSTNGYDVTIYLPQVESWTSNSFVAQSVVEVKPPNSKKELLG